MKLAELFKDNVTPVRGLAPIVKESIENELTDKVHEIIEQVVEGLLNDSHGIDGDFHFKSEHNSQSGNIIRLKGEGAYHLHDDHDSEEAARILEDSEKEIGDQIETMFEDDQDYSHVKAKIQANGERANTVLFKYEVQLVKE